MNYRTMLFMPGNNPGMLQSSDILCADAIIIDLEDAVSLPEKDAARELVKEYLKTFKSEEKEGSDIYVRVNRLDTDYFYEDLDALKDLNFDGIMLAKASQESVEALSKYLDDNNQKYDIFCLIETSQGVEDARNILAKSKRVKGVLLGAEDLTLDLGAKRTKESDEIKYSRMRIVSCAKSLGLQAIDTPWTDTDDIEGLVMDTKKAKAMGMTGKALISPRHVDHVNEIFSPSKEDIDHAIRVMEALKDAKEKGLGAFSLDGKMVDRPIILRATNTLKMSGNYKEEYDELL